MRKRPPCRIRKSARSRTFLNNDEAGKAKETTAENAEKNGEEETPETADKQVETAMDTTVREDKKDTTVQENKMDTTVQDELDPTNW